MEHALEVCSTFTVQRETLTRVIRGDFSPAAIVKALLVSDRNAAITYSEAMMTIKKTKEKNWGKNKSGETS